MVKVTLPTPGYYPEITPKARKCLRCGNTAVHKHGRRVRQLRDWRVSWIEMQRFRCLRCGATWTVYPQGVSPGVRFSLRAEQLMVLLYVLGLSYRKTAAILSALGIAASPSTVLNFVQAQGVREALSARRRLWEGKAKVHVIGVDGTGVKMAGKPDDRGVVVVTDIATGLGLWVEAVDEKNAQALKTMLSWVLRQTKAASIVTDEGSAYPQAIAEVAAEREQMPSHRLCAAHFRRNKIGRLRNLLRQAQKRKWGLLVMELRALEALLRSPPTVWSDFAQRWLRIVQHARPPAKGEKASWHYRLRLLLLELTEKAEQVDGITNNRTEQLIGRAFKVRVRSMRGFKREDNRLRFLHLALAVDARAQREGVLCFT